jgi:hypothetical protein
LALDKQYGALGIRSCILDAFKRPQGGGGKIAKDAFGPHFASQAIFDDVQTVWCQHDNPL